MSTVELLSKLHVALLEAGDERSAGMVHTAISGTAAQCDTFLRSNELWGGAGSIADQGAINQERALRRKVEAALVDLGEEQMRLGLVNPRTETWVRAFSQWQRQRI